MEEEIWHILTSALQFLWRVYIFNSVSKYFTVETTCEVNISRVQSLMVTIANLTMSSCPRDLCGSVPMGQLKVPSDSP